MLLLMFNFNWQKRRNEPVKISTSKKVELQRHNYLLCNRHRLLVVQRFLPARVNIYRKVCFGSQNERNSRNEPQSNCSCLSFHFGGCFSPKSSNKLTPNCHSNPVYPFWQNLLTTLWTGNWHTAISYAASRSPGMAVGGTLAAPSLRCLYS